jgi:hypothetical protein
MTLGANWTKAFARDWIDSITLCYRNVGRRVVAETLLFDTEGRVTRGMSQCHVAVDVR